mgnify:CR=1 FL=1
MIRSMTAFARKDAQDGQGTLTCEIRTVNHRYLEPSFRLPEALRELENPFREELRKQLKRGKVDVSIRLQSTEAGVPGFEINEDIARAVNEAANHVNRMLDNPAHINALDILRWPGVLSVPEQEAHLRERFQKAKVEIDPERITQEMVMLAQKSDVAEELDRLDAHIGEVTDALKRDEAIGRRLDFLMQELNREANTLSSKSIDAGVTRAAVDLKVLIEQVREQVQNIE